MFSKTEYAKVGLYDVRSKESSTTDVDATQLSIDGSIIHLVILSFLNDRSQDEGFCLTSLKVFTNGDEKDEHMMPRPLLNPWYKIILQSFIKVAQIQR